MSQYYPEEQCESKDIHKEWPSTGLIMPTSEDVALLVSFKSKNSHRRKWHSYCSNLILEQ